jgi:hypothetical protein
MKPRHPNLEWIKKVLADLECDRGDPQIAALMDRQMGDLVETSSEPAHGVKPAEESLENSRRIQRNPKMMPASRAQRPKLRHVLTLKRQA